MARASDEPQAQRLRELADSVVELRAELLVTQATLAAAMAEIARLSPDPGATLGDAVARTLGFSEAAARGMAGNAGRPSVVTGAAERLAGWAENFLRAQKS